MAESLVDAVEAMLGAPADLQDVVELAVADDDRDVVVGERREGRRLKGLHATMRPCVGLRPTLPPRESYTFVLPDTTEPAHCRTAHAAAAGEPARCQPKSDVI